MKMDPNLKVTAAENTSSTSIANQRQLKAGGDPGRNEADIPSVRARAAVLAERLNQLPENLLEKVAAIAHALRQGTYQVSPEQTAEAILSDLHTSEVSAA